jgi:hypothetical protein
MDCELYTCISKENAALFYENPSIGRDLVLGARYIYTSKTYLLQNDFQGFKV